jgi:hypothetical protein
MRAGAVRVIDLRGLGLRLGLAAAGGGLVLLATTSDDLSTTLIAAAMAVMLLSPLVILLLTDLGMRLGTRRASYRGPAGPPTTGEWVIAAVFDSAVALMVYAGVLTIPTDSGELLAAGLVCAGAGVFLTGQLVRRWWRNRRRHHPR